MEPTPTPAYPQQPVFVMPVSERNGLGTVGFFTALIGLLIPTGIVSILGLMLSLAAIGRAPRGFATGGVIVGLLGTVFWLLVMVGVLVLGVAAVAVALVATAGAFIVAQPEVVEITSDMVNLVVATEQYEDEHGALPGAIADLGLAVPATLDPWGHGYRFAPAPSDADYELAFSIVSAGPDGAFGNDDDVSLERLEHTWALSFDDFQGHLDEFGRRMERLEAAGWRAVPGDAGALDRFSPDDYLRRAVLDDDGA